jgi:transketolase
MSGGLPEDWDDKTQALIENLQSNPAKIATRKASQNTLNAIGPLLPNCWAARRIWHRVT